MNPFDIFPCSDEDKRKLMKWVGGVFLCEPSPKLSFYGPNASGKTIAANWLNVLLPGRIDVAEASDNSSIYITPIQGVICNDSTIHIECSPTHHIVEEDYKALGVILQSGFIRVTMLTLGEPLNQARRIGEAT